MRGLLFCGATVLVPLPPLLHLFCLPAIPFPPFQTHRVRLAGRMHMACLEGVSRSKFKMFSELLCDDRSHWAQLSEEQCLAVSCRPLALSELGRSCGASCLPTSYTPCVNIPHQKEHIGHVFHRLMTTTVLSFFFSYIQLSPTRPAKMCCLPCWPFSDVYLEDDPMQPYRRSGMYQYEWNGQQWELKPSNVSLVFCFACGRFGLAALFRLLLLIARSMPCRNFLYYCAALHSLLPHAHRSFPFRQIPSTLGLSPAHFLESYFSSEISASLPSN